MATQMQKNWFWKEIGGMKKGIAWILLLILCLSWTVSLAETSKELTFQDIPWFSSPEEASKILVKSGFVKKGFGKKMKRDTMPKENHN